MFEVISNKAEFLVIKYVCYAYTDYWQAWVYSADKWNEATVITTNHTLLQILICMQLFY